MSEQRERLEGVRSAPARRLEARELTEVPEVGHFLKRLGLGTFVASTVHGFVGRNDIWAGTTSVGRAVLVKRLVGEPASTAARMRRLLTFERFAATAPKGALSAPTCLGADEALCLVAYEYLEGATSGAELMVAETFGQELARQVGRELARLHDAPPVGLEADDLPPTLPSLAMLEGLSAAHFMRASAAELQAWQLLQGDRELHEALRSLLAEEQEAPHVPAHCDLRVDQLLVESGRLHVIDWEEFRVADAARDVGSFAGEWLYRAVLDVVTHRGDAVGKREQPLRLDPDSVRARGVEKLARLRPLVRSFWDGYRAGRRELTAGLEIRATAFAGWHLLDRLLAGAANNSRLQPVQRAAAGVGRTALLAPDRFVTAVGLDGEAGEVAA